MPGSRYSSPRARLLVLPLSPSSPRCSSVSQAGRFGARSFSFPQCASVSLVASLALSASLPGLRHCEPPAGSRHLFSCLDSPSGDCPDPPSEREREKRKRRKESRSARSSLARSLKAAAASAGTPAVAVAVAAATAAAANCRHHRRGKSFTSLSRGEGYYEEASPVGTELSTQSG